ncbi:membrane-spanning 4-domains subfamily A member 4A [Microcaecilia unicolor]|uniref:Membrane-spanning 4-domains subfamily A member 4A-like n=1 Tax=Microcaecilia unicolor TaxID=1415580 RepID=A0A6P7ZGF3_9AMPH|nr:membrane-spanning 4-domains subfamily A member 4A-like [Microcaecilia unicolor]
MSSAVQESSGIVVITQIVPQPKPMSSAQTDKNTQAASLTSSYPRPLQKFYQGEPKALGVTQILTGVIQILFGIILGIHSRRHEVIIFTGTPFWSGILYIISGSLSIAASCNPAIRLVRASLGMNIVSSIAAGIGIIIYTIGLMFFYRSHDLCYDSQDMDECEMIYNFYDGVLDGGASMLFVFTVLEFCVSISTSAFACKTVCRNAYSEVNVVIYQNTSPNPVASDLSPSLPPYEETKSY